MQHRFSDGVLSLIPETESDECIVGSLSQACREAALGEVVEIVIEHPDGVRDRITFGRTREERELQRVLKEVM